MKVNDSKHHTRACFSSLSLEIAANLDDMADLISAIAGCTFLFPVRLNHIKTTSKDLLWLLFLLSVELLVMRKVFIYFFALPLFVFCNLRKFSLVYKAPIHNKQLY